MAACRYRCVLTHKPYEVVHHITAFNVILREAVNELGLDYHEYAYEYEFEELEKLSRLVLKKHYQYGLGVCLTNEVHNDFHNRYGSGDNTLQQWQEYVKMYKSGKCPH